MKQTKLAKNLILSLLAQVVSLLAGFVVGLIVPKYIPDLEYSYWQVFLLYYGYVGLFHFGLTDGLVLRYSQYDFDQLDKPRLRSQFLVLITGTSTIAVLACFVSSLLLGGDFLLVAFLVSIGIVIKNYFAYTSYTFQLTNRINEYAYLVIAQRLLYGVLVVACLLFGLHDFYWFCLAYLISELLSSFVASSFNKGLYLGKGLSFKETMKEAWANVSSGAFLMVSNLSSMLIVGGAKMVILWRWNELVFGKLAFAFSVANLFLEFVTAISVVLFPSLKRMKEEELPDLYGKIRNVISPLLFLVMIAFFPLCWVLELWLPKYTESLAYLGVLLPIVIFSSKVSLLTNNYLKAYRKEKAMLLINVICVVLGMAMFLICAYLLNDLDLLLYSVVLIILIRSIVSEIVVMKIIKRVNYFDFAIELIMTVIFVVAARYFSLWTGFLIYAVALAGYCILYRKNLAGIFRALKKKVKEKSGVINKE